VYNYNNERGGPLDNNVRLKFDALILAWWHPPLSQEEEFEGDIDGRIFWRCASTSHES